MKDPSLNIRNKKFGFVFLHNVQNPLVKVRNFNKHFGTSEKVMSSYVKRIDLKNHLTQQRI